MAKVYAVNKLRYMYGVKSHFVKDLPLPITPIVAKPSDWLSNADCFIKATPELDEEVKNWNLINLLKNKKAIAHTYKSIYNQNGVWQYTTGSQ